MHPTTTQLTGMGRFDSAEVVTARRQFDGALGRERHGGAEAFRPRFTGAQVRDEPLLVIDLESGSRDTAHRRISQVTPPPPLMPSSFDGARTPTPPAETNVFAGAVAKLRTLGVLRNEGLNTDAGYASKRAVFLDLL